MIYKLEAAKVEFVEEEFDGAYPNVITVAFGAENVDENSDYFLLQRCAEAEPDGEDEIYCELCDQGISGYGGIKSFTLSRNLAEIEFEKDAELLKCLEKEAQLTILYITFKIDSEKFELIRTKLKNIIFRDCDFYFEK